MRDQIIQVLLSTSSMSEGDTADALLNLLAAQPPAQAEQQCNCDLRTKLVGDGCSVCNPERWRDLQPEPFPNTERSAADKFCDGNCVWTDHHPDCPRSRDTDQQRRDAGWVPVEASLPPNGEHVEVRLPAVRQGGKLTTQWVLISYRVTHWRPLDTALAARAAEGDGDA